MSRSSPPHFSLLEAKITCHARWRWLLLACVLVVYSAAPIHLAKHAHDGQLNCPACVLSHANALLDTTAGIQKRFSHNFPPVTPLQTQSPRDAVFVFSSRAPPVA